VDKRSREIEGRWALRACPYPWQEDGWIDGWVIDGEGSGGAGFWWERAIGRRPIDGRKEEDGDLRRRRRGEEEGRWRLLLVSDSEGAVGEETMD
jgi:hypothetical protein